MNIPPGPILNKVAPGCHATKRLLDERGGNVLGTQAQEYPLDVGPQWFPHCLLQRPSPPWEDLHARLEGLWSNAQHTLPSKATALAGKLWKIYCSQDNDTPAETECAAAPTLLWSLDDRCWGRHALGTQLNDLSWCEDDTQVIAVPRLTTRGKCVEQNIGK